MSTPKTWPVMSFIRPFSFRTLVVFYINGGRLRNLLKNTSLLLLLRLLCSVIHRLRSCILIASHFVLNSIMRLHRSLAHCSPSHCDCLASSFVEVVHEGIEFFSPFVGHSKARIKPGKGDSINISFMEIE